MVTLRMDVNMGRVTALHDELEEMTRRAGNTMFPMKIAAQRLMRLSMDSFKSETDPYTGSPWRPLSEMTIRMRRKGRKDQPGGQPRHRQEEERVRILQDTSIMKNSIRATWSQNEAIIGTSVQYARDHQFGSPERRIPQRRFIGMNAALIQAVIRDIERWIMRRLGMGA